MSFALPTCTPDLLGAAHSPPRWSRHRQDYGVVCLASPRLVLPCLASHPGIHLLGIRGLRDSGHHTLGRWSASCSRRASIAKQPPFCIVRARASTASEPLLLYRGGPPVLESSSAVQPSTLMDTPNMMKSCKTKQSRHVICHALARRLHRLRERGKNIRQQGLASGRT